MTHSEKADSPFRIGLLLLPDANLISLAAALDPFRAANDLAEATLYDWQMHSVHGGAVTLSSGLTFETTPLPLQAEMDLLILIAGPGLVEQATPALRSWLRQMRALNIPYCGVDGGCWILARAGLLNGRKATTHWEDLEGFSGVFPEVTALPDRFIIDGPAMTAGGPAPCLELMIHLIGMHHGQELSGRLANALHYDPGSGAQRMVSKPRLNEMAPQVAKAVEIMQTKLTSPVSTAQIAREVGLSPRRLEMLFTKHLETAPGAFFLKMRLREGRRLAQETGLSVSEIAGRTGFSGPSPLARAYKKAFGQTISETRAAR